MADQTVLRYLKKRVDTAVDKELIDLTLTLTLTPTLTLTLTLALTLTRKGTLP